MQFLSLVKLFENSTIQRFANARHARKGCHDIFGKCAQLLGLQQKKVKKIVKKSEKEPEKSLHFLQRCFIM